MSAKVRVIVVATVEKSDEESLDALAELVRGTVNGAVENVSKVLIKKTDQ